MDKSKVVIIKSFPTAGEALIYKSLLESGGVECELINETVSDVLPLQNELMNVKLTALRVAADPKARDKGVLVVMNDEIHAAKYVTKTHTTNVSTFQTPTHGPLGLVMKKEILFFKTAEPRVRFDLETIDGFVPIIATYAGMKTDLLDMLDLSKLDGLIIEAFGAGNIPKETAHKLQEFIDAGLPIALVSRCFNGIAEPVYAYEGGGVQLHQAGVFFIKELNAPKARIKLLIALNAGLKGQELKDYIEG